MQQEGLEPAEGYEVKIAAVTWAALDALLTCSAQQLVLFNVILNAKRGWMGRDQKSLNLDKLAAAARRHPGVRQQWATGQRPVGQVTAASVESQLSRLRQAGPIITTKLPRRALVPTAAAYEAVAIVAVAALALHRRPDAEVVCPEAVRRVRRWLGGLSRRALDAKLFEQVPLVNREGMDVQVKDAVSRKAGSTLKVDDIVDDSLVLELEKEGFIGRIYKQ